MTYITLSTGQEDINCNDRSPLSRHPNVYNGNVSRPLRNFISQQFLIKSFRFNLKQSNRNFIPTRMKRGSIKKTCYLETGMTGFNGNIDVLKCRLRVRSATSVSDVPMIKSGMQRG